MNLKELRLVFQEIRLLVERPDNNFDWSGWDDKEDALAEIDRVIQVISEGRDPQMSARILFAPTGPLQELSISSGWGDEFIDLADRYDGAVTEETCTCLANPSQGLRQISDLGMDSNFAEITLHQCPDCGRIWLRYFFENEAFTGSGRWFLGNIREDGCQGLTAESARAVLEGLPWYFAGGCYFGTAGRMSGPFSL